VGKGFSTILICKGNPWMQAGVGMTG
jgi:hypothetical protein